ncbi:MAG: preprotein translocase subunit SecG [Planctomycetaceae bacterium]|nr:preprotein translocase subunit SecG [Planctomycetaceae bacterium]
MSFVSFLIASVIIIVCVFLILLILIQRGKGGGLAGAFGGMGGQSAFGTKAGDTFMRITIVVAAFWFLLCIGVHMLYKPPGVTESGLGFGSGQAKTASAPSDSGITTIPTPTIPAPAAPVSTPSAPVSTEDK